ncbi:DEAD/DEAH box helicase [Limnohabitans sp. Rim8]|uniref:DEAD/DEAH box helicase n=1 Tax=Limnohabitans sp. Rim8 TaxID=1100718 RepID=UPI002624FB6F|nr:DEAD/DEAH box helicase [Limnohabitans sp. Rim8]
MPFSTLGLRPELLKALKPQDYPAPTPIQTLAIPAVLQGIDVQASAQTGSGKTAAYVLPLLELIMRLPRTAPRRVHSLVLVPTRELAVQVGDTLRSLAVHLPALKITVVFGGVSVNPQMMGLRGSADVVVATPGRLLDLVDKNALSLSAVQTLVLDEADKLLDLGFQDELQAILKLLPARRQNLLFSATFPPAVQSLADALLTDPLRVDVLPQIGTAPDIAQRAISVEAPQRTQLLRHLFQSQGWKRVLVFAATQHACQIIAAKLRKAGINAEPFHGQLGQGKRSQVLADFKASRLKVVIATDVAARGLDISELPVVVNFDLPRSAVDYTHRIGRTGRAGHSGLAVSFVSPDTEAHWRLIEKRQNISVPREIEAGFEPQTVSNPAHPQPKSLLHPQGTAHDPRGGIKGKRPNKKDKLRMAQQPSGQ